jgi:uncharacterized protein YyaL (SSP411 family)
MNGNESHRLNRNLKVRFSPNPNRAHLIRWHGWGSETFCKAQEQDKVVMLYLGAFWCGFCQRMDETSLSDDDVIVLLNAFFIPIRVENAQRPDIDIRYNHNGWPTIVFLTPRGDTLSTVNYLPPEEFANVLVQIQSAYEEKRIDIEETASVPDPKGSQPLPRISDKVRPSAVSEISNVLMGFADSVNGGYGPDHKFPHPEANDFLLYRYQTTGDKRFLDHVCLTLVKMRASETYDEKDGGFFRYSSKPDWSEPHREKLLFDHAGILCNCLSVFRLTGRPEYRRLAEEIICYLNTALSDSSGPAFRGCQDYPHVPKERGGESLNDPQNTLSVVDELIYTDANALAVCSYLKAWQTLGRLDVRDRALDVLEFLWRRCRAPDGSMCHYHDGRPHVSGLLIDQLYTGLALLDAYEIAGEARCLGRAVQLGDSVLAAHANPDGGFQDICFKGEAHLRFPLTLIVENGIAARKFLRLAEFTGERKYRKGALWALSAFSENFGPYGVYAAPYGRALGEYMALPIRYPEKEGS